MSAESDVIAANAAFYAAITARDRDAMARLWAGDDRVSCIHPGWTAIVGRAAVLASWTNIFAGPSPPEIRCQHPQAIIVGIEARILCVERIGVNALAATNLFRLIDGVWRLVHHHASEIVITAGQRRDEPKPPSRSLH